MFVEAKIYRHFVQLCIPNWPILEGRRTCCNNTFISFRAWRRKQVANCAWILNLLLFFFFFAPGLIPEQSEQSEQHVHSESVRPGGHHGNDASPRGNHQHEETDRFLLFPCRCFLFCFNVHTFISWYRQTKHALALLAGAAVQDPCWLRYLCLVLQKSDWFPMDWSDIQLLFRYQMDACLVEKNKM